MINWYEALKAQNRIPVKDRLTQMFGAVTQEPAWKTITGVLPLTFTAKGGTAADWVIEGNDDIGKNLLDLGEYDNTAYDLRAFVENGQLRIVGKYNDTSAHTPFRFYTYLEAGSYILSGSPNYSNTGYAIQAGTVTDSSGAGFVTLGYDRGDGLSFTLASASWVVTRVYTGAAAYDIDVDFVMPIMLRKAGTSEDFEPYQKGVGERTENLVFTYLNSASIGSNGLISSNNVYDLAIAPVTSNETYSVLRNYTASGNCVYGFFTEQPTYDSTTYNDSRSYSSAVSFSFVAPIDGYVAFWSHEEINRHQSTCVKGSTAPSSFIPYGYQIPITVSQQGQTDKNYDIYIGDTPLTEGETVSKTSTGVDIELFEGENVVSTTLYNKPDMEIKYK